MVGSTGGPGELMGMASTPQRHLRPVLAFLGSIAALGLGFVYVGELQIAIASMVAVYGVVALCGWSGLFSSSPTGFYIGSVACLVVFALSFVWPTVIAVRRRQRATKPYNHWWFYVLWAILAMSASGGAFKNRGRLLGYDLFRAPSLSMSPSIERDDFFMVDPWRYYGRAPAVGDIVVLDLNDGTGTKYVKRVIGLPGDRVELRDSTLVVNGRTIVEPYLHTVESFPVYGRNYGPIEVGPNEVFVLGDYRDNSIDSRKWGAIPIIQLHGRAQFIWLSYANGAIRWNRLGIDLRPKT